MKLKSNNSATLVIVDIRAYWKENHLKCLTVLFRDGTSTFFPYDNECDIEADIAELNKNYIRKGDYGNEA